MTKDLSSKHGAADSGKKDLFIELAVEEIPSGMAQQIADGLKSGFEEQLAELAVDFGAVECLHTPRRFALRITDVSPETRDVTVESFGPSEAAAFNPDGSPTKAAAGFAKSKGAKVEDLEIAEREKGRFLVFRKTAKGEESGAVIARAAPEIIRGVRCPKSMKWRENAAAFARPVRKISCFYGGKPLKVAMDGVPFSETVSGHRFAGGKPFKPADWQSYLSELKENFVIADPGERLKMIEAGVKKETERLGGFHRKDPELLETVRGLVEYPLVLSGEFEKKFLKLPAEVLTSVMKNHQKYFPVFSESGELLPYFVFVCGTPVKDTETVVRGNQRVLRARFADAEFFHSEDMKTPLEARAAELGKMVYMSGLGSYADKTTRLEKVALKLARMTGKRELEEKLKRAAKLSKADLATQMVFEIPELQGVMGRRYGEAAGEDAEVSAAIEEHYMPTARDSALPRTDTGAVLAIADKIDNICSCFYLGTKPSGSSDPLALRRQAIGLINIALERGLDFSVPEIAGFVLQTLEKADYSEKPAAETVEICAEITEFVAGRFKGVMVDDGAAADSVEAVISARFESVTDCQKRLAALEEARKSPSFAAVAESFKRVVNIAGENNGGKVTVQLFEKPEEKALLAAIEAMEKATGGGLAGHLKRLEGLKEPVDGFFDAVMVMDKDAKVRNNRLALLARVKNLFFKVGDLSKLTVPGN